MFKRISLFLITNLAIVLVLSFTARLLGVDRFLMSNGLNLGALLVFAALFGFGGSLISLLISKWMAKMAVGAQVITEPSNSTERWLVDTVRRHAQLAGVGMPEVAIYDAPEINAFATGANRNNALVAVSTGLLRQMTPDEADAVLGHEMSHVANGDMVTLALIQGVVNTFVIFFARVIGSIVDRAVFKNDSDRPGIGLLDRLDRGRARAGHPGDDDRHVVQPPSRVSRRRGRSRARGTRQDDRGAPAPAGRARGIDASRSRAGIRYRGSAHRRPCCAVHVASAAGGAHRRASVRHDPLRAQPRAITISLSSTNAGFPPAFFYPAPTRSDSVAPRWSSTISPRRASCDALPATEVLGPWGCSGAALPARCRACVWAPAQRW